MFFSSSSSSSTPLPSLFFLFFYLPLVVLLSDLLSFGKKTSSSSPHYNPHYTCNIHRYFLPIGKVLLFLEWLICLLVCLRNLLSQQDDFAACLHLQTALLIFCQPHQQFFLSCEQVEPDT